MDCTVYLWEAADPIGQPPDRERRALLERTLKRAFPVVVDEQFIEILRSLDEGVAGDGGAERR